MRSALASTSRATAGTSCWRPRWVRTGSRTVGARSPALGQVSLPELPNTIVSHTEMPGAQALVGRHVLGAEPPMLHERRDYTDFTELEEFLDRFERYGVRLSEGEGRYSCCAHEHDDHPSLAVNTDKLVFQCFACGWKGNLVVLRRCQDPPPQEVEKFSLPHTLLGNDKFATDPSIRCGATVLLAGAGGRHRWSGCAAIGGPVAAAARGFGGSRPSTTSA